MKNYRPFLLILAFALGITAAFAGKRITPYVYVDGGDGDGYYNRIPGPSYYSLGKCVPASGGYCFYGAMDNSLPARLSQAQIDHYVSTGRLSAHKPGSRYEFTIEW